jgi:hypothetical protein
MNASEGLRDSDWPRLSRALDELMALEPEAAARRAAAIAGEDPALGRQLQLMLEAMGRTRTILDRPRAAPPPRTAGERIGAWRVLEPLGRGGMSEVYRVERADGAFTMQAALKLIRVDRPEQAWRLVHERELLARLAHPGIARILDGGESAAGEPYLVTELIDGPTLDRWLEQRPRPLSERLSVFEQIVAAVSAAHANLLVHRDIKPRNVVIGSDGRPRLLDFGIAMPLQGYAGAVADAALTPDFAAPEQLRGEPPTAGTDVYALGALLHWLLTGRPPLQTRGLPLAAMIERVGAERPAPVSACAAVSRAYPARALRGDLDAIVLKALEKDPARRYASAVALGEDVRRHRGRYPVLARAPTRAYRLGRLVARHRLAVALGSALAASVVLGVLGIVAQAERVRAERDAARRERDLARVEAARNDSARQFFALLLRDAPVDETGAAIGADRWLEHAAVLLETEAPSRDGTRAALALTLAEVQAHRHRPRAAERLLERVLAGEFGALPASLRVLAACERAAALVQNGDYAAAAPLLEAAITQARAAAGAASDHLVYCLRQQGIALAERGEGARAMRVFDEALAGALERDGAQSVQTQGVLNSRGLALLYAGRPREAARDFERAARINEALGLGRSVNAIVVLGNLALATERSGSLLDADRRYVQAIAARREREGASAGLAQQLVNHAGTKLALAQPQAAEALLDEALPLIARSQGERSAAHAQAQLALGELRIAQGRLDEADVAIRRAAEALGALFASDSHYQALAWYAQAQLARERGNAAQARTLLERVEARVRDAGAAAARTRVRAWLLAVDLALDQRDLGFAATAGQTASTLARAAFGAEHALTARAELAMARVLAAHGDSAAAAELAARAGPVLARTLGDHPQTRTATALAAVVR